jgi:hypothetical protein
MREAVMRVESGERRGVMRSRTKSLDEYDE